MPNPIALPQGRSRWHGPRPWKVGAVLVGLIVLSGAMLYYGSGDPFSVFRSPKPERSARHYGESLPADVFVPASSNGYVPGAPVDTETQKKIEGLTKYIEQQDTYNKEVLAELAALKRQREEHPHTSAKPDRGERDEAKAAVARRKALAQARIAPFGRLDTGKLQPERVSAVASTVQAGWVIPFLVKGLVNSDIPGSFGAHVSETVYATGDYRRPLIPQGAAIVANAKSERLLFGNERLPTYSVSISIPGQPTIELPNLPMTDAMGQMGLADEVDHHYGRIVLGVVASGVWEGATRVIEQEAQAAGMAGEIPAEIADNADRAMDRRVQTLYDIRPTIRVLPGSRGVIFVTKDIKLSGGR